MQLYSFLLSAILATSMLFTNNAIGENYEIYQDKNTDYYGVKYNGDILIPAQFQIIFPSEYGLFMPIPSEHLTAVNTEELLSVVKNRQLLRVNKKGKIVFKAVWNDNGPDYYVGGLTRFIDDAGKIGMHDPKGNIKIPAKYDYISAFYDKSYSYAQIKPLGYDYALICDGCYLQPLENERQHPLTYDSAGVTYTKEHNDLYFYRPIEGGKWGVIDRTGKEVILLEHDSRQSAIVALENLLRG